MTRRTVTLHDIASGGLPHEATGVRWPDGTVERHFNVGSDDYIARRREAGLGDPGAGEVLTDPAVECDRCADKCG